MKSYIVLVVVCAAIGLSQSMSPEERKSMEQALVADCKTKEGASDADAADVLAREVQTTPTGKCLNACVLETTGMVQNGKPSVDGAVALAKIAFDANEEAMVKAREVAMECAHVADTDRCELAIKLLTCVRDAVAKRGYNLKELP